VVCKNLPILKASEFNALLITKDTLLLLMVVDATSKFYLRSKLKKPMMAKSLLDLIGLITSTDHGASIQSMMISLDLLY
jgi:hypothetical protein